MSIGIRRSGCWCWKIAQYWFLRRIYVGSNQCDNWFRSSFYDFFDRKLWKKIQDRYIHTCLLIVAGADMTGVRHGLDQTWLCWYLLLADPLLLWSEAKETSLLTSNSVMLRSAVVSWNWKWMNWMLAVDIAVIDKDLWNSTFGCCLSLCG